MRDIISPLDGLRSPFGARRGTIFSPLSLFASGEPGGWYDPSDLTTLFQDAAGTTPVTAVEQPVGLMLDKSRGLVLGSELVTNGTFDTNLTGWALGTGSSGTIVWQSPGSMRVTRVSGGTSGAQALSVVAGQTYKIAAGATFVSGSCSPFIAVRNSLDALTSTVLAASSGAVGQSLTLPLYYTAASTGTVYLHLQVGTAPGVYDFDNISAVTIAGAHLTQSTSTARPVLSARVNLLTQTEAFDEAVWVKSGGDTVTANTTVAPDGTVTADTITTTATPAGELVYQAVSAPLAPLRFIQQFKRGNHDWVRITVTDAATRTNAFGAWFNLATGAVGTSQVSGTGTLTSKSITSLGDGWYLCEVIGSVPDASLWVLNASADADNSFTRVANGTRIVWGADLRVANDGVNLPAYQRVGVGTPGSSTGAGSSDYTVTGFPLYLRFDGTDDFLVSPTITPGIDKAQVFAGVRKLSDAFGMIAELSSAGTNAGTFSLFNFTDQKLYYGSRGATAYQEVSSSAVAAPVTTALTGLSDTSASSVNFRLNGISAGTNTASQGGGNYTAYPLYVGMRGGTSRPFNGRLYPLIVRFGATLTDTQIAQTESYVSTQMGGGYVPVGYDFLVDANGDQLTDASGNALYTIPLYS